MLHQLNAESNSQANNGSTPPCKEKKTFVFVCMYDLCVFFLQLCVCKSISRCPLQKLSCPHLSREYSRVQVLLPQPPGLLPSALSEALLILCPIFDRLGAAYLSNLDIMSVCLCGFYLADAVKLICSRRYEHSDSNWKGCAVCCDPWEMKKQSDTAVEVWFSDVRQMNGKLKRG